MTRRHVIAVVVALLAMGLALLPPLWVRVTGDEVTLAIRPVDPLSFFRGNYVDIRYDVEVPADGVGGDRTDRDRSGGDTVYVLFADERPGRVVGMSDDRPSPTADQFCLEGRFDYDRIDFPELEQFFVTAGRARSIEASLDDALAVLRVTDRCRAVLVDVVPR
jgi:uncharacterized membrane-anchored protein